jgi:hypothetical protein
MAFYEQNKRWPRAAEFKGMVSEIEEKWMGKVRPAAEKGEEPEEAAAEGHAAGAPPADLPATLAATFAEQDPEMAEVLRELVARRRR